MQSYKNMKERAETTETIDIRLIALIESYVDKLDFANINDIALYHDLGIYGDDTDELLDKYADNFNVSIKEFPSRDYFPNEGVNLLSDL